MPQAEPGPAGGQPPPDPAAAAELEQLAAAYGLVADPRTRFSHLFLNVVENPVLTPCRHLAALCDTVPICPLHALVLATIAGGAYSKSFCSRLRLRAQGRAACVI